MSTPTRTDAKPARAAKPTKPAATTATATTNTDTATVTPASAVAAPARVPSGYAPIEQFFGDRDASAAARTWSAARMSLRIQRDPQLLLSIAIALPVLAVEGASELVLPWLAVVIPVAFVALQVGLTAWRTAPEWLATVRLGLSLLFVGVSNAFLDPSGTWPLSALAVPVVALAASRGGLGSITIGLAGMATILLPLSFPGGTDGTARQETLALAMAAVVVAVGSRRVVASLERSSLRLRSANHRDRRHARQLAAVESVGRLLAREGPTAQTLDNVMGLLEGTFGYRYPSVYVWDGFALQLGAQRNYRFPIQTVTPDKGIIGRIVRTQQPILLPDARKDPDFLSGDPDVVSEIGIPLVADGDLLGVLNVESSGEHRLDDDDFATMQIVGDRLAAALALGRERQKLTERAALLDRLTTFATVLGSSLDPSTLDDDAAEGASAVIPADTTVIVNIDEETGKYRITAVHGGDRSVIGQPIAIGEGVSGRSIKSRNVIVDDHLDRSRFPRSVRDVNLPDALAAMAAPMVIADEVVGAVTWLRSDLTKVFTVQEQEIAGLLAGRVGFALINARLHQKTADAAITDPLTGIHNRRHFDAALEREDAVRRRVPAERRRMRAAIIFDLDYFGKVNKRFGHQIGDRVLRVFADTLRSRVRAADLVARYGGEEFVVILENASREEAHGIAEAVRKDFALQVVETGTGEQLRSTVSAGCAQLEAWEVEASLLLERADVALAMAKAGGRDQVVAA